MPPPVPSQAWPGDSAVLLVHGVGNYRQPDYASLLAALRTAVGPARWSELAVYTALYDEVNDWFAEKLQAAALVSSLTWGLRGIFGGGDLGEVAAEGVGDVVWPVLSINARMALRDLILSHMRQMVIDGDAAVPLRRNQKLYIVCHSLGCFHTYEALCAAASDPAQSLQPVSDDVHFKSVVMMASPVQLVRRVAREIIGLVPSADTLACLGPGGLHIPGQPMGAGGFDAIAERVVSLTGNLDPVGGHLFRDKVPEAYMDIPGVQSIVEDQHFFGIDTPASLADLLRHARLNHGGLSLTPQNPHDWTGYVTRNAAEVAQWLA